MSGGRGAGGPGGLGLEGGVVNRLFPSVVDFFFIKRTYSTIFLTRSKLDSRRF